VLSSSSAYDFVCAACYQICLSISGKLVCAYKCTYIYVDLCICIHTHSMQNEQLNMQGESFKENIILKFHIYHEQ